MPERGDIVFIPFLFTTGTKAKKRPALVVSSAAYHASRSDVMIAGITTNLSRPDFVGQAVIDDWKECGLWRPSAVSGIIMTVRESQLGVALGRLSSADQARIDETLRQALGL